MPAFLTHWYILIETARHSEDAGSDLEAEFNPAPRFDLAADLSEVFDTSRKRCDPRRSEDCCCVGDGIARFLVQRRSPCAGIKNKAQ